MTKFKAPLQKEILQVGEVMVLLTSDTSYYSQGLHSAVFTLVRIQHGKVSCMLTVNGDIHLARDLEDRIFLGHDEVAF